MDYCHDDHSGETRLGRTSWADTTRDDGGSTVAESEGRDKWSDNV